eukprot:Lithocolla_globosa_v1_NODE_6207_length_1122_cov_13.190253.p2 type:complete len:118 gc:universal NODE_6207_length_1122_cov_13.190253:931-578(-)
MSNQILCIGGNLGFRWERVCSSHDFLLQLIHVVVIKRKLSIKQDKNQTTQGPDVHGLCVARLLKQVRGHVVDGPDSWRFRLVFKKFGKAEVPNLDHFPLVIYIHHIFYLQISVSDTA